MPGDPDEVIEILVQEIWAEMGKGDDQDLNKKQTQKFLNDFIKQLDPTNDGLSTDAFEQIFKLLDHDKDGQISQKELASTI